MRVELAALVGAAAVACGGARPEPRARVPGAPPAPLREVPASARLPPAQSLVDIPGDAGAPPFRIMRHEVTNAQFAAFVAATGHVTDPERRGVGSVWWHVDTGWDFRVRGADWRHPHGPGSSIDGLDDHPVVQVSWRDARAFCAHHGLRLPTEAEWMRAARGAGDHRYPWGDDPPTRDRANYGTDTCCAPDASDGFVTTGPVGQYPRGASPHGVHDMAGNVWEWTADPYPGRPGLVTLHGGGWGNTPPFLRVTVHHANPPDRGLSMVGIRCAGDP